jgi:leader peptidase (prepilin peptidase)/N-methyltransferase
VTEAIAILVQRHPLVVLAFAFVLGSLLGSFLNVVAHRLPAGKSLVHPSSHCPKCGRPIRWRHNLPIVGWLLLRGRCFDCQARISPRYPLVELAAAALVAALAAAEWVGMPPSVYEDGDPSARSLGLPAARWLTHAIVGCTLLAGSLIEWDGKAPPLRLYLPALVVAAGVALAVPSAPRLPGWWPALPAGALSWMAAGLAVGAVGGVVGGAVLTRLSGRRTPVGLPTACLGVALGPAGALAGLVAVLVIETIALLVKPPMQPSTASRDRPTFVHAVLFATLVGWVWAAALGLAG